MSSRMVSAIETEDELTQSEHALAVVTFGVAFVLLRLPFGYLVRLITAVKRVCPRAATPAEAEKAVTAARAVGRWFPGRAACLEDSLTAVLIAALHGRVLDWCIGARTMPYSSHAWVEVDGKAIGELDRDRPYQLLLRI